MTENPYNKMGDDGFINPLWQEWQDRHDWQSENVDDLIDSEKEMGE